MTDETLEWLERSMAKPKSFQIRCLLGHDWEYWFPRPDDEWSLQLHTWRQCKRCAKNQQQSAFTNGWETCR